MSLMVTLEEAKSSFVVLLEKLESCEENEIIIERNGQPYLKVVPVESKRPDRIPGSSVSLIEIKPEFYDPMTDEELKEWGML